MSMQRRLKSNEASFEIIFFFFTSASAEWCWERENILPIEFIPFLKENAKVGHVSKVFQQEKGEDLKGDNFMVMHGNGPIQWF